MEESNDRELEAILNLVKLTQDGVVIWHAVKPWGELTESENTKYLNVMYCEYGGRRLRLYIEKHLVEKPAGLDVFATQNRLASLMYPESNKTYPYWKEKEVLEISNANGQSLWRFPYKPAIKDLVEAAKYQAAGVKEVLDSLLQTPSLPSM